MIVRPSHFEYRFPLHDPSLNEEDREQLKLMGAGEPFAFIEKDGPIDAEDRCFYCGEQLVLPCVIWKGVDKTIWLHPHCAEKLSRGLMRDVRELKKGKAYADKIFENQKSKKQKSEN